MQPGLTEAPCYAVIFARDRSFWAPFSRRVGASAPDALGQSPSGDFPLATTFLRRSLEMSLKSGLTRNSCKGYGVTFRSHSLAAL